VVYVSWLASKAVGAAAKTWAFSGLKRGIEMKKRFFLFFPALAILCVGCSFPHVFQTQTSAPPPTVSPPVTLTLQPGTATPTPAVGDSAIDWDRIPVIGPIVQSIRALGGDALIVAIVSALLTLLVINISKVFHALTSLARWAWNGIRGRGADLAFEKEYLDWLVNQHRHLGLLPAQVVARRWGERPQYVELEDVYVRLSMSSQPGDDLWAAQYGGGENSWRRRPWIAKRLVRNLVSFVANTILLMFTVLQEEKEDRPRPEGAALPSEPVYAAGDFGLAVDKDRQLIVRGDPGSGKTTLLRYLAVTCARSLRGNRRDNDSPRLVRKRLMWSIKPFPILVCLSRHSNVTNWDEARTLIDTFLEEMPPQLRRKCPKDFFEKRLENGNCLVLLDAFDELGTPQARSAMARHIGGFLEVYGDPSNRMVVTTRVVGYEGQLNRYGFHIRTVQDLNDSEIHALVEHRYKAIGFTETIGREPSDARVIKSRLRQRAQALIQKIEETPRLRQLATNPMLPSVP